LQNVRDKYKIICECEDISDDFILMNDDFYILNKVEEIKYYHRGKLKKVLKEILEKI
jgi:CCR4-NOT transcriptional regulation complex NOT5 subunit